jgi:hypothetical protein
MYKAIQFLKYWWELRLIAWAGIYDPAPPAWTWAETSGTTTDNTAWAVTSCNCSLAGPNGCCQNV